MERPELDALVEAKFDRYAKRVIRDIKRLPKECRQSGDDSPLRNVWEEWVVQMQGTHSDSYDVYEETIRVTCRGVAEALPREEQGLLWLWTDDYCDWNERKPRGSDDGIPFGVPVLDALENEFFRRVCSAASDVELPERLARYLYPPPDE
jgi:hypothetical protein